MASEWIETTVGNLCSKVMTGGTPLTKHKEYYEGGTVPWLKTKEVNFCRIRETENHITEQGLNNSAAKLVPAESIIVAMYGQGDTAGRVAVNEIPVTTNQACCNLVVNPEKADYKFLYFYLKSSYFELVRRKTGSAQPNLNTGIIKEFEVTLPSLSEQTRIGNLLWSLDDKIELNRQINETLEQMAQALFKSWFVDFDPVIDNALDAGNPIPEELAAKAEQRKQLREAVTKGELEAPSLPDDIRSLFPSEFEFTEEMGWIPKGWLSGKLDDLLVLQRGFDLPKSKRTEGNYPLIASSGQDGSHNECKVDGPGVVTGRSGRIGVVTFVHENFWPLNTTLWVKEYKISSPYHGYFLLKGTDLERYAAGSAVPTLNRNHVHEHPCVLPTEMLVEKFDDHVASVFEKIRLNVELNDSLTEIRDRLLPKLISGELQIPEAEQQIAEALN